MKQAEKGIRFIDPDGKERFRIPDGEMVRIITSEGGHLDRMARYVDEAHAEIGGSFYDIREFAEWMEQSGSQVIPIRSALPDKCYNVLPSSDEIIIVRKGESGYYHTDKYGHDRAHAQAIADEYNAQLNVTKAYKMLGNGWTVDVIAHILSYCPGITTKPLEVLSMYDGMSCGHLALDKLGATVLRYYATEIDKYAIKTTQTNFPDTIQLGDAFQVREDEWWSFFDR